MNLQRYLKELRLKAGLQQIDVSKALGYRTSQFISNWERGHSHPPMSTLPVLASLYNVSAERIYLQIEKEVLNNLVADLKSEWNVTNR